MTPDPYQFMPGGRPAWPTVQQPVYEAVPMRVCVACKVERKVTAFGVGSKKCSGCYSKEKRARDKANLEPKRLFPISQKHHMGAHSKSVSGGAE